MNTGSETTGAPIASANSTMAATVDWFLPDWPVMTSGLRAPTSASAAASIAAGSACGVVTEPYLSTGGTDIPDMGSISTSRGRVM